ncbi:hypothetical protein [Amycolatopsis sp. YIM 10]|uniref:hypothetical protein n=1 Tax=Amycolatopsis sp. YIM 10 TaxID=2653857 RepID=UPI001290090E|nr:hypothetical protein [Amycolatopsis sp. YIM 10]QFU92282.1 hypothetical protein YIM_35615 [Amycolatopsis sp. YIM 10]
MREHQRRLGDEDEEQPLSAEVPRPPHPDLDPPGTKDVDTGLLPNHDDVESPPTGEKTTENKPEPPD